MNELVSRQEGGPVAAAVSVGRPAVDSWVEVMRPLVQLAEHIHNTSFVPSGLRGNSAATAAAMLYGRELNFGPMQSLRSVFVVDGTPGLYSKQMRAMVQAAGHEIEFRERTNTRCVMAGRRRGRTEWTVVTWTMDDARAMGLDGRPNWRKMPRRMLTARCTSELCELVFADIIGGMACVEELSDSEVAATDVSAVTPSEQPVKRTARRRTSPRPPVAELPAASPPDPRPDGPPLPNETPGTNTEGDGGTGITSGQSTKLHAVLSELNIPRGDRPAVVGLLVGRTVSTSKDLTKDEAGNAIEALERVCATSEPDRALDALLATMDVSAQPSDGEHTEP